MSEASAQVRRRLVRFVRNGNYLTIPRVTRRIFNTIRNALTYLHVRHLRGKAAAIAGRRIAVEPVECFELLRDPKGVHPPQILLSSGWYPRLRQDFKAAGYAITVVDNTPPERAAAYRPYWSRLKKIDWRWRQEECIRKIAKARGGLVICPTGYGKSFMIGQLCRLFPHARFDVTTHAKNVLQMLYEDLDEMLPSVGLVTGEKKILDKRVMCYSGKSLHHADGDADFLITDEVHEFATDDYLDKIARYRYSRRFGFTANGPGDRNDGADFELEGAYGPVLFELPYEEAVAHGCIVNIRVMWVDVVMDINPCADYSDDTAKLRNGFWRNAVRNEKIAAVAEYWHGQGKQVLILVDTLDHACHLKKLLPEFTLVYRENGMDEDRRAFFIRHKMIQPTEPDMDSRRRMLLTRAFEEGKLRAAIATGVWSRGVNFKQLQVLIRADGKASPISDTQLPGRLSRIDKDKNFGILVDFHDQFDNTFKQRAASRKRRYRKMGWEQIESPAIATTDTRYRQGELFVE